MVKEYIGSQEHFEDEINAYYDQKKQMEREMQNQYEKEMWEQMGRDDNLRKPRLTDFYDELDPRGCSEREYADYLEALDEWKQSIEENR